LGPKYGGLKVEAVRKNIENWPEGISQECSGLNTEDYLKNVED